MATSETHIGVAFAVRDRVYELKKSVNLGFLDVELNRRLAPDVYLGMVGSDERSVLTRPGACEAGGVTDVVVLDYGSGNLRSAERALHRAGAKVTVTADADAALAADGLVVPGVGAFAACMAGLRAVRGDWIIGRRLAGGRPVLGICVGMQVLFSRGVEHGVQTEGCDEWSGTVERLKADILPHMGWNTVAAPAASRLFAGLDPDTRFYFVHSYAARRWELESMEPLMTTLVTWAEHGEPFVAAVENGPLWATQFHPEKSGDAGAHLLRNWIETL